MLFAYPPTFLQRVYPSLTWNIKTTKKELFLTFDDGPTKGVTEHTLKLLKQYNAKATFFCLGVNIEKEPELFQQILDDGHAIGNHTYNHLNGWKSSTFSFLKNVEKSNEVYPTRLFRPPYGRIRSTQIKYLKKQFHIVMWSILTQDYNKKVSPKSCAKIATYNWKKGSILVFHDSVKAKLNMLYALEEVLVKAKAENWVCAKITE